MIPQERLQVLVHGIDSGEATRRYLYNEGRSIIDGAVVTYDLDDMPQWLTLALSARDARPAEGVVGDLASDSLTVIPQ